MPDTTEDQEVAVRPFWSGTITFGLVSIPVSLFPAHRSGRVALHVIDARDGSPLRRRYVCSKEEKPLDSDEVVRGYEVSKSKFVTVSDEELESLEPEKSRDIDLKRFVKRDEIDPVFFERAYYLVPAGNSTKAYRLLAETLESSNRAGIATFVMRDKEYLVAILSEHGILRAETLRFVDEIRSPADVGLPEPKKPKPATVKKFVQQIGRHEKKTFAAAELKDTQADKLLALVKKKEKKHEDVFEAPEPVEEGEASDTGVIDLMQLLKRSMNGPGTKSSGRKPAAKSSRKSASKKSTRKTSARKRSTTRKSA